jgi:hypothetical protein
MTPVREFVVMVTGSRTWTDYGFIYRRLAELATAHEGAQRIVIVHGDAPDGADPMAAEAAKDLGYDVRPYPAHWELGPSAGKSRNSFMLQTERPRVVLAFWKDSSPGTGDAIEKALDMGIYTEIHER